MAAYSIPDFPEADNLDVDLTPDPGRHQIAPFPSARQHPAATDGLVYRDPTMAAVVQRAQRIARSDASVMVCGESGTGKEVIARYIHRNSRRANGPFVAVNCAAIPEQLLESELFGHERGAFSGALMQRIGKLEAAQNGSILLDEISEMDRRLQAKLLRAIQEREIDRVGGRAPVRLNVRIIATTTGIWNRRSPGRRFERTCISVSTLSQFICQACVIGQRTSRRWSNTSSRNIDGNAGERSGNCRPGRWPR
jgi:transcriptional regulator of acetoin/glycerol metabolism